MDRIRDNNFDSEGNFSEHPTRYQLDTSRKKEIIDTLAKELKKERNIRFAFLHGSFLEAGGFRDIDIAIYLDEDSSKDAKLDFCTRLSVKLTGKLGFPVDINVLNQATLGVAYYAVQGQILIYRDLEEVLEYKEDIIIKYLDFSHFIKENLTDLLG